MAVLLCAAADMNLVPGAGEVALGKWIETVISSTGTQEPDIVSISVVLDSGRDHLQVEAKVVETLAPAYALIKTELSSDFQTGLFVFVAPKLRREVLCLVPAAATTAAAKAAAVEVTIASQSIRFTAARFSGDGTAERSGLSELADVLNGERRVSRRGGGGPAAIVGLINVDATLQLPVQQHAAAVQALVASEAWSALSSNDQLSIAMRSGGCASGFYEPDIDLPPLPASASGSASKRGGGLQWPMRIVGGGGCEFVNADPVSANADPVPKYLAISCAHSFGVAALLHTPTPAAEGTTVHPDRRSRKSGHGNSGVKHKWSNDNQPQEASLADTLESFSDGLSALPADLCDDILAKAASHTAIKMETLVYVADVLAQSASTVPNAGDAAGGIVDASPKSSAQPQPQPQRADTLLAGMSNFASRLSSMFGGLKNTRPGLVAISGPTKEAIEVLRKCYAVLEESAIEVEGIYRISGSSSAVGSLHEDLFLRRRRDRVLDLEDPHTITSAVKKYFRSLPDSVLESCRYDEWMQIITPTGSHSTEAVASGSRARDAAGMRSVGWGDPHADLLDMCGKLQPLNQILLADLITHLQIVAGNFATNKMKSGNLGVVFGPTLLRPPDDALLDPNSIARGNALVTKLLACSAELRHAANTIEANNP